MIGQRRLLTATLTLMFALLAACSTQSDETTRQSDAPLPAELPTVSLSRADPEPTPFERAPTPSAKPTPAAAPVATATVIPDQPRLSRADYENGSKLTVDDYGLWTRDDEQSRWSLLELPENIDGVTCWVRSQDRIVAAAVRYDGAGRWFSLIDTTMPARSWNVLSVELGAVRSSCPVLDSSGRAYLAVAGLNGTYQGIELARADRRAFTSRVLSENAQSGSALELHRQGGELVVGYCQGSDLFPCDRDLVAVNPEPFFAGADFSFDDPCSPDRGDAPVCAYDFTVPYDGRLSTVDDELWQLELHETYGTRLGGEWDEPFGRWAAGPLGTEPVPLPTGFGVRLFSRDATTVARVPLAQHWEFVRPEYRWYNWSATSRSWEPLELSPEQITALDGSAP